MITWHFYKAWPVKLVTTDLKAQDNSILIESFELAYERFTRRKA
jgi:phage tail-like protein